MRELQTGDLVFTSAPTFVARLIRLLTATRKALRGDYAPSHVGMVRIACGVPYVQEALWGRGFVKSAWPIWRVDHANEHIRVVRMPFTGMRTDIGMALERLEGTPYASLIELMKSVGNNNKDTTSRDFCSAACQRALEMAMHRDIMDLQRPDNTDPEELYRWALKHGGKMEAV